MVALGKRCRRLIFGVASRFLTIFIDTAAKAQELSAATERIADAVGAFILTCVRAEAWWGDFERFFFSRSKSFEYRFVNLI